MTPGVTTTIGLPRSPTAVDGRLPGHHDVIVDSAILGIHQLFSQPSISYR
jgi:hypothetical protein